MTRKRLRYMGGALVAVIMFGFVGIAHAADGSPEPAPLPLEAWIGIALGVLGGIAVIWRGLTLVLGIVAKRTKTTVDDRLHDRMSHGLDRFEALLAHLGRVVPVPNAKTPRTPESGRSVGQMMLMLATLGLGAGLLVATHGCAPSARESTIKAALVTADASREAFITYDDAEQAQIVAKAASLTAGQAQLASYRERRERVEDAFNAVYRAIAMAATLNDDRSLETLKMALEDAFAIVNEFQGKKP